MALSPLQLPHQPARGARGGRAALGAGFGLGGGVAAAERGASARDRGVGLGSLDSRGLTNGAKQVMAATGPLCVCFIYIFCLGGWSGAGWLMGMTSAPEVWMEVRGHL